MNGDFETCISRNLKVEGREEYCNGLDFDTLNLDDVPARIFASLLNLGS